MIGLSPDDANGRVKMLRQVFTFSSCAFLVIFIACLTCPGEALSGPNVCEKKETYTDIKNLTYSQPIRVRTYTFCYSIPPKCSKYKIIYKTKNKRQTQVKVRTKKLCCAGYAPVPGEDQCQPICSKPCLHGICIKPDVCQCTAGYFGTKCTVVDFYYNFKKNSTLSSGCWKMFFGADQITEENLDMLESLDPLLTFLLKITPSDTITLLRSLILSEEATKQMSLNVRNKILLKAYAFCRKNMKESKTDNLYDILNELGRYMEGISNNDYSVLKEYARKFESSGDRLDLLVVLSELIQLNRSVFDRLLSLIEVFPNDISIPEDVLADLLQNTLDNWNEDEREFPSRLVILDHLLQEYNYLKENGLLLQEEFVLDLLMKFTKNEKITNVAKIQVFELSNKYFELSFVDQDRLLVMHSEQSSTQSPSTPGVTVNINRPYEVRVTVDDDDE